MTDPSTLSRGEIAALSDKVYDSLTGHISDGEGLAIVKAPPGSGKTYLLLKAVEHALSLKMRVSVGTQTNSQADDMCRRLAEEYPDILAHRFAAGARTARDFGPSIRWIANKKDLPQPPCVVIATVAKWSLTELQDHFDILFVDEAWQMAWSDFMLCGQVSSRFVLIGDPGQIPPVVPIAVERWETSPRAPHQPAPQLILEDTAIPRQSLELPACRRLPCDSVDLVRPFYDFPFGAWAVDGERYVKVAPSRDGIHPSDDALDLLSSGSTAVLVAPTPDEGPPLEFDEEIAILAAATAARLVDRGGDVVSDESGEELPLNPQDIGIAATHRVMNTAIYQSLPSSLRGLVVVDTPERWQGLERKVMIVVHPLSGVVSPSAFDLETGRLCVMTSRHRAGLIVVSRDHVRNTLETHIPSAEQAVGRPDVTGRGHKANLDFWESMESANRVVSVR